MTTPLLILAALLIAIGVFWWRRAGVGAERPASLLVTVGSGIGVYAVLGPLWLGTAIGICIFFVMVMLLTQTNGGRRARRK